MTSTAPQPEWPRAFLAALLWLWPAEGGWYDGSQAFDTNPTNFGITQNTYNDWRDHLRLPRASVRTITRAEAQQIYLEWYWRAGGCDALPWPLQLVHFDACVNHGTGNAEWLRGFAVNWSHYIALRRAFYVRIIERNPAKEGARNGWMNRMRDLQAFCLRHPEVPR
jgi:hypothetical protein